MVATKCDELVEAQKGAADQRRQGGPEIIERDDALNQLYAAQLRVGRGMTQLVGVMESYPELRSSDQFLELQAQLEGTENRIAVARRDYIEAVRRFNTARRSFPTNFVAGIFGFESVPQMQFDEAERETPQVEFDFGRR